MKGEHIKKAKEVFKDTEVNITVDGHGERHLGAALGTEDFKNDFVTAKVDHWVNDIKQLSEIAAEEPRIALSKFIKGICWR